MVPSRMFALTTQDTEATPQVIQGTLYISNFIVKVLIDPGPTHSFISYKFASKLKVELVRLECILIVSTSSSGAMYTNVMYRSCKVEITKRELEVNLILLHIRDSDVILGMDWIVAHHAHIDCFHKEVMFKIPNEEPFSI